MAYADYAFYTSTYLGNAIAEADFPRLAERASEDIDKFTFDRAAAVVVADEDADAITKIQKATCAIAEVEQRLEADGEVTISSERIGNYSVAYANPRSAEARKLSAAKRYLGTTGLLFAGVDDED